MSQFIEMFGSVDDNPKSYDVKKVGDFAECFAGATPSTKIPSYWENGIIPWMSSGEVHKGRVQDTDAKITQQGYDGCSTKMVPIHSIVVALAGQGKTRGTVAINDIELCTNQSLCAIVPNEEVNYEYLFHNLRGRYRELRSMSGDVDGRGGLNLKHIQSIKVIVPPMSEQMKFVSIAHQADKSEFDGFKSQFIEMFGTVKSTKPLTDFIEISFPGEWGQEDKDGSGVKVIRTTNFTNNGKLDLSDVVTRDIDSVKVEKKKLSKGDIILERSGGTNENPVGRVVYFEEDGVYLFNNFTQLLRCKEGVNSLFIFYSLFNYYQLNKYVIRSMGNKTTGIQNLKMDRYWQIPIADVSIERQKEFESIYRQADKSENRRELRIAS